MELLKDIIINNQLKPHFFKENLMFKKNLISILLFLGFLFNAYCISNVLYNDEIQKYSCVHKSYLRQFMLFLPDGFEKRSIQERMDVPLIIMLRHHSWPVKDFSGLDCNKIIIEYFNSFMNKCNGSREMIKILI